MLLSLSTIAHWQEKLNPAEVEDGCPTDVPTWGIAKTDPWDNPFHMTCDHTTGRTPRFRSAGPDGLLHTDDDVLGHEPPVEADACIAGCEAAFSCGGKPEAGGAKVGSPVELLGDVAACVSACSAADPSVHFYVDTCRLLADCATVGDCVSSALGQYPPFGACRAFGLAAARTFKGDASAAGELEAICDQDVLRVPELVCVEASKTAREASLCHLTVNRNWARDIAGAK